MPFAQALGEEVAAKRAELNKLHEKEKLTSEDVAQALQIDAALRPIEKQYNDALALEQRTAERKAAEDAEREKAESQSLIVSGAPLPAPAQKNGHDSSNGSARALNRKSLSAMFTDSPEYRAMRKAGLTTGEVTVANTLFCARNTKAAGDPILSSMFGYRYDDAGIPEHLVVQPQVMDLCRVVPVTGASSVRYMRAISPVAGVAAPVAEGALKPEVQPRWTPVDAPLEVIAEWTAVTLQALDDIPSLRAVIDSDLRNLLLSEIDNQILNGTGVPPNLTGILTTAGLPVQAFGTDALTTINAAITKISVAGAGYPTGIVMNPADWASVRMLNSSGVYWFGPPTEQGVMRLWGVPVVISTYMPAGFALVGNFQYAIVYERWGVRFVIGWKNDDLIKNLLTIVCEARLAVAVSRLAAFVKADIAA
jgi:hypothetical protein